MTASQNFQHGLVRGALALSLAGAPLAAPAFAGDPSPERAWLDEYTNETYVGYEVSIGFGGARVFADSGWTERRTRLYSTNLVSVAAPIWERADSAQSVTRAVASADFADVHAVVTHERPIGSFTTEARLEVYGSTISPGTNSYLRTQPFVFPDNPSSSSRGFCEVSPDGRWVAAAIRVGLASHLTVFDLESSTPSTPVLDLNPDLFGTLFNMQLSDDGSKVYVGNNYGGRIYDVASGATIFSESYSSAQETGHTLSGDGKTLAYPHGRGFRVKRLVGNGYVHLVDFLPLGSSAPQTPRLTALDRDGKTLVGAYRYGPNYREVDVFAWDLDTGAQLVHRKVTSTGSLDNIPSALDISDDASRIAFSVWGDDIGSVPEVTVLDRQGASYQLLAEFDLAGSVGDLDLSADGKRMVCSGRSGHFNVAGGDKFVSSYDLGADFRVVGRARAGQPVTLEYYPQNTTFSKLLVGAGPAASPETLGVMGTLYLDRMGLERVSMSPVDGQGKAELTLTLPNTPGETLFLQAYCGVPVRLSESWVPLIIE